MHDKLEEAGKQPSKLTLLGALNITALLGQKGADYGSCAPANFKTGDASNILSAVYVSLATCHHLWFLLCCFSCHVTTKLFLMYLLSLSLSLCVCVCVVNVCRYDPSRHQALVAFEDSDKTTFKSLRGGGAAWSPAACNTYAIFDFRRWFA